MTTAELDATGTEVFERHGARSAPQVVYDFLAFAYLEVSQGYGPLFSS